MNAQEYCRDKVSKSGSNFVTAFSLLSKEKRLGIEAIYTFCREVDDIADEYSDPALAKLKLAWWKNEVDKIFENTSNHPVLKALKIPINDFSLPKNDFLAVIDGVSMDIEQKPFANWFELNEYCDKVAGAVGRLSVRVFGPVNEQITEYASLLGRACQYTNIIRDIGEDGIRKRCYLPVSLLKKHKLHINNYNGNKNSNFINMCSEMANINYGLYREAFNKLPQQEYSRQRAGIVMGVIYRNLLKTIENSKFDVLDKKISLAPLNKLWIAWKASWGSIPVE